MDYCVDHPCGLPFLEQLINVEHPLNDGLVADWSVVEGLEGGRYLYDVFARNDGTLTNGPVIKGATNQPDVFGALSFDGTDDYIHVPNWSPVTGDMTVAVWFRATALNTGTKRLFVSVNNASSIAVNMSCEYGRTSGKLSILFPVTAVHTGTATLSANTWYHACFWRQGISGSWSAGTVVNGVDDGSTSMTSGGPDTSSNPTTYIGQDVFTAGRFVSGQIASIRVYNRRLGVSDCGRLFDENKRGNPELWNWLSGTTYFFLSSSGVNADAGIGYLDLLAVAPTVTKSASPGIGLVKCTAVAPVSSKAAGSGTGIATFAGASLNASVGSVLSSGLLDMTPLAPVSSKAATGGIGLVKCTPVAPLSSKAANAGIGHAAFAIGAIAASHLAAAGIGLVDLVGVSPATSKAALSGIGKVDFVAALVDTTGGSEGPDLGLVASACFVWQVGYGCTIERVT